MSEQFPLVREAMERHRNAVTKLAERISLEIDQIRAAFEQLKKPVDQQPLVDAITDGTTRLDQLAQVVSEIIPDEPVPEPLPAPEPVPAKPKP